MRQRYTLSEYVIIGLIAIGIIDNFRTLIIPIVVLGAIFLLYKFPPNKWSRLQPPSASRGRSNTSKTKRKQPPFRVIQGNKGNDDDTPKYH
ncbi:hypothetical protein D3C73_643160 [compost metagenome]